MSRNKYPEETYNLIMTVSIKLFMTKGYEKTSVQDIIDNLGGLTKGALYHHFKSKEDILIAVVNHICKDSGCNMKAIINDSTLNGREKLERMFSVSISNPNQADLFAVTPNLLENPTFLSYYIKNVLNTTIPEYIVPTIKEGVADGSIVTDYPEELSSLIMFLSDVWLNPLIMPMTDKEMANRALLVNQALSMFHITLFDDNSINHLLHFRNITE